VAQIRDRVRALNAQPQDEFKVRCDRVFKKLRRAEANLNTKQRQKLAKVLAQLDQLLDGA
ncbi:MAG TPA: hypothetical protein V6D20_10285, partial [Candidatus Obscuribacterales bacterium]